MFTYYINISTTGLLIFEAEMIKKNLKTIVYENIFILFAIKNNCVWKYLHTFRHFNLQTISHNILHFANNTYGYNISSMFYALSPRNESVW